MGWRFVQSGSSPRRLVVSAAGQDVRTAMVAPGTPFNSGGGHVPAALPGGVYYAVAFGTDGEPALPNPWWSAQLAVEAGVDCTPLRLDTLLFDHDVTEFQSGEQVSAYGAGHAVNAQLNIRAGKVLVLGMIVAERQMLGSVRVVYRLPRRVADSVTEGVRGFVGGTGRYSFTAAYDGMFPFVLVAGVMVRTP